MTDLLCNSRKVTVAGAESTSGSVGKDKDRDFRDIHFIDCLRNGIYPDEMKSHWKVLSEASMI
jgi:hypothetical protein